MLRRSLMAIVVFLFASDLNAQLNRGALTGSVTDATGALVPNVNITVRDIGTNLASGNENQRGGPVQPAEPADRGL